MFPERIETDRLVLEQISSQNIDLFALYEFYSVDDDTEEVFEFWDGEPHHTLKDTQEYLTEAEELWEEAAGAKYAIRPKEGEKGAHSIAGTTGLYLEWEKRSGNLGALLGKRFWGRGYSGECAVALLAVAFERLCLDIVSASHVDGNENSRRAVKKFVEEFDGQYEGMLRNWLPLSDTVANVHRYTISYEEYKQSSG